MGLDLVGRDGACLPFRGGVEGLEAFLGVGAVELLEPFGLLRSSLVSTQSDAGAAVALVWLAIVG